MGTCMMSLQEEQWHTHTKQLIAASRGGCGEECVSDYWLLNKI